MDIAAILGPYAAYLTFPVVLIIAVVAGVFAFFGYTLFKKCLSLFGAVAFGIVGFSIITPLIPVTIPVVNLGALVGIVMAIIGAILIIYVYKLALFLIGGGVGFLAGYYILVPMLSLTGVVAIVVSAVVAIVAAVLTILLFKPLFIIFSSVVLLAGVGALAAMVIFAEPTVIFVAVLAAVGLVVGIFAARKQFVDNSGRP